MNTPNFVRLSSVVEINPRLPKNHALEDDEEVSFLAMADISEDGHVQQVQHRLFSEVRKGYTPFKNGDVLLAKITPCFENGKAALVDGMHSEWAFGSTEFHVFRPSDAIDGRYLFHLLWNERFRAVGARNMTGSAGQKRVTTSFVERIEIPLPALEEQRRIVAILDKADSIRNKRREALDMADSFLRAVFLEMFGDLESNTLNWDTVTLGKMITNGPTNGLYVPASQYGVGTPILRIDGFYEGKILPDYHFKRVNIDQIQIDKFKILDNSIIINRVNSKEYVGKAALIENLEEITVYESNMMNFSIDLARAELAFIVHQLGQPYLRRQIATARKDAVNQSSINQQDVKGLKLRLPPIAMQKRFTAIHKKVTDMMAKWLADIENTKSLTATLQSSLLNPM